MHDSERRLYYFARRCYRMRDERTPRGDIPWPEHFANVVGRSIDDYMRECVETDMRARVIEHELSVFGWSPLEDRGRSAA